MASLRIETGSKLVLNLLILLLDAWLLRCLQCFSDLSWKDCNKQAAKNTSECKPPKVCFMSHRIFKRNGQQEHQFIKACYDPDLCPEEKCRGTFKKQLEGSWCETKCCKYEDFCNSGMTRSWKKLMEEKRPRLLYHPHFVWSLDYWRFLWESLDLATSHEAKTLLLQPIFTIFLIKERPCIKIESCKTSGKLPKLTTPQNKPVVPRK